ncbi:MAG: HD domain-containing protein [Candidatus Riflebacteria bacterium]|nr:HD domain-containing protein [Candidatus Riflebacteria bacterium]
MTGPHVLTIPQPLLTLLREVLYIFPGSREGKVWLVGGAVRDLALGATEMFDLDLALPENPAALANEYARQKKAGFVMLDEEHAVARILRGIDGVSFTIDLAKFRAPTIEEDLAARDFTFNAMAVQLNWPLLEATLPVYDPLGGWEDLQARRIKPCSDKLFTDDPLRILRAYRFASRFDSEIMPDVVALIRRDAPLLKTVSGERARDELFKILSVPKSAKWIRAMCEAGVIEVILPEFASTRGVEQNCWHHLDVFEHTLEALEKMEELFANGLPIDGWQKFKKFLAEPTSGSRTIETLFKLAMLLHDIGKPVCKRTDEASGKIIFHGHEMEGSRLSKEIGERLRLSSNEVSFLMKVAKNHMRPGVIIQEGVTDRRLFRYYSETGRDGVGIALLSLADRSAARGTDAADDLPVFEEGIRGIMDTFYKQMEYARQKPLLTGHDLIAELRIMPGPMFKEILEEIREAQHLGRIHTRAEAAELARRSLFTRQTASGRPPTPPNES